MHKNSPVGGRHDPRYSLPVGPLREFEFIAATRPVGYGDLWWYVAAALHAGATTEAVCCLVLLPATHPPFDVDKLVELTALGQPFDLGAALLPESERNRVAEGYLAAPFGQVTARRAAEQLLDEFARGKSKHKRRPRDLWTAFRLHPWVFLFDPINDAVALKLGLPPDLSPEEAARAAFHVDPSLFLGQRPRGQPSSFNAEVAPELAARDELALLSHPKRSKGTRAVGLLYGGEASITANARIQRGRHERDRRGVKPLLIPFEVAWDGPLVGPDSPERRRAFQDWSRGPVTRARLEIIAGLPHGELCELPAAHRTHWTSLPGGVEIEAFVPEEG